MGAERDRVAGFGRLEDGLRQASNWYLWGPYVSERQRGTVREDYSADGAAWDYLPHDHARSRAYRWGEHFAAIRGALDSLGLWDEADGLYYDQLVTPSGEAVPVRARSMVGIIPALAVAVVDEKDLEGALAMGKEGE